MFIILLKQNKNTLYYFILIEKDETLREYKAAGYAGTHL